MNACVRPRLPLFGPIVLAAGLGLCAPSPCPAGSGAAARSGNAILTVVAVDSVQGEWGIGVLSTRPGAVATVPWARAGEGVVGVQGFGSTAYGPGGLTLMARPGVTVAAAMDSLLAWSNRVSDHQYVLMNARGDTQVFTGPDCPGWAGSAQGQGFAAAGHGLSGPEAVDLAGLALQGIAPSLTEKLLAGLREGDEAGTTPFRSAALLVVKKDGGFLGGNDRYVDIRIEDAPKPLIELARLYAQRARTDLPAVHTRLGDDALRRGDRRRAELEFSRVIALYREAIQAAPRDPGPMNSLAWFFATHRVNLDEAQRLAQDAARFAPDSWQVLDTLAEISLARGRLGDAQETLNRALQLSPGNPHLVRQVERVRAAVLQEEKR